MAVVSGSKRQQVADLDLTAYISPFETFVRLQYIPEPPFPYFPPTGSGAVAWMGANERPVDLSTREPPPFHHARAKNTMELLGRLPKPRPMDLLREDVERKMNEAFLSMPEQFQELVRAMVTQELYLKQLMTDGNAVLDAKMTHLVAVLEWLGNRRNGAHYLGIAQRILDTTLRYILAGRGF